MKEEVAFFEAFCVRAGRSTSATDWARVAVLTPLLRAFSCGFANFSVGAFGSVSLPTTNVPCKT